MPVTVKSGKHHVVHFRFACDKALRYVVDQVAFLSLRSSEWARAYYDAQRARGHSHREALRALGAKWVKIIFILWERQVPYDEPYHLATMARQSAPNARLVDIGHRRPATCVSGQAPAGEAKRPG